MSKPPNILSQFATYSYHQFLAVCDSTQTAEALAKPTRNANAVNLFHHPFGAEKYTARAAGSGNYVVLIDGTTDAHFQILSSHWTTVINPTEKTPDGVTTGLGTVVDGTIDIYEPNGALFLKRMEEAATTLKTGPTGLSFVLKTIFVGHTTDVEGGQDIIGNIKPLIFQLWDIKATFDSTGSKYQFGLVGAVGGGARLPQTNQIAAGLTMKIDRGLTVDETLKKLETEIANRYEKEKKVLQKKFDDEGVPIDVEKDFRKVNYKIILDEKYKKGHYIAGVNEVIRAANSQEDPTMQFTNGEGVERMIERVMTSSTAVEKESKPTNPGEVLEERKIFKVYAVVNSTPDEYTLEYHVKQKTMTTTPFDKIDARSGVKGDLEFDYIFTGQNTDILDFNMKFEMGLAFFQSLVTSNNVPDNKTARTGYSSDIGSGKTDFAKLQDKTGERKNPLFLGSTQDIAQYRNVKESVTASSYKSLMQRQAALENVGAILKIRGNPVLLDEMMATRDEIDQGVSKSGAGKDINPEWINKPTKIKINVKTPVNPDRLADGFESFWYDGLYIINEVTNHFKGGSFTQELVLFSVPISTGANNMNEKTQQTVGDQKNQVVEKLENVGGGSGASGEKVTVVNYISQANAKKAI
jgi:hypothetical protein